MLKLRLTLVAGRRLDLPAAVVAATVGLGVVAQARDIEPQTLVRAKEMPRGVKAPKWFESALKWTDKNGENLLIHAVFKTSGKDEAGEVLPRAVLTIQGVPRSCQGDLKTDHEVSCELGRKSRGSAMLTYRSGRNPLRSC
jgi:hypothetical protein